MTIAIVRRLAALVVLATVIIGLHLASSAIGTLDPAHLLASGHDPVLVATSAMGLVAAMACLWLAGITAIETVALALNLHPLQRLAGALAPAAWRTLVLRPITLATLVLPPVAMPVVVAAPAMASSVSVDSAPQPQLEMVAFGSDVAVLTMSVASDTAEHADPPELTTPEHDQSRVHVVEPGENLWSIASEHLVQAFGRHPTPSEVKAYWGELIALNRANLPDPANPDLIYRGIELQMPPVQAG